MDEVSCATTPARRNGPTATASCCRSATPRCCRSAAVPCGRRGSGRIGREDRPAGDLARRHQAVPSALVQTPGHPEYRHTTGVETTTGPLGAGCGNSVGMAIAERWFAARYNKPGFTLFSIMTLIRAPATAT
ncbi:hypothetical protein AB5I41_26510 [Sphingomonas sp. MMS24-JH45]